MLRLHRIFVAQYMKNLMEYKVDFLTGAISFLLGQVIQIAFLGIIFSGIPDLVGWEFNEILFIYGFSLIPKGLDHLLFDNLWSVGYFLVRKVVAADSLGVSYRHLSEVLGKFVWNGYLKKEGLTYSIEDYAGLKLLAEQME